MNCAITSSPGRPPADAPALPERDGETPPAGLPDTELDFYQGYAWCLNPFPTIRETVKYLGIELARLPRQREHWQTGEVMTNVYLLSCALLNAVDEYLRGKTLHLPGRLAALPLARGVGWLVEKLGAVWRQPRRARVRRWRENWQAGLDLFLAVFVADKVPASTALAEAGDHLTGLLRSPLPADLQAEHIYFPSAFRTLDLSHVDVLTLGRHFVTRFPERLQPVLVLGLRTAGSYFAPLLCAFLRAEGYREVACLTLSPIKGPGARERSELKHCARGGYTAVILDDPPHTGDTIVRAADLAVQAGFPRGRVAALVPTHPARLDWGKPLALSDTVLLSLEPEEWHKQRLLDVKAVESRLTEYFRRQNYSTVRLIASAAAEQYNAQVQSHPENLRRTRIKRVYEVCLLTPQGDVETRYVLAKSVGWGWLSYHAFLAGHRLAGFVPPVLGLRDGILYSEWLPQPPAAEAGGKDREEYLRSAASYVAARVRSLGLGKNPLPGLGLHRHHDGFRLLEKVLSRAYGRFVTAGLVQPRIRHRLAQQPCPVPTVIDGKMQRWEWVASPRGLLKTDYEHHGLGKNELNVIDPAYDLAEAVLELALSPEEEERLLRRYVEESGDAGVEDRLLLHKVLAGTWSMASALKGLLQHPQPRQRQQVFHQQFVRALHFLTVHTARFCGGLYRPPQPPRWRSPLVVLDVDGVLDRWLFGFPTTTAAGIQALALLQAHEYAVAVDTARSVTEVQEYCRAYGFVGGVAEHGSYLWDAAHQRGRTLVSTESLRQMDKLRKALEQLPGIFLDDRYQFSIRAFTYEDRVSALNRLPVPAPLRSLLSSDADDQAPVPLPTLTVQHLLADLGLERLRWHQTTMDTTIVAQEVNKGSGLAALLNWVGQTDADTTAVGDSEADLAMFRVARHSFAPAQISCARLARLLGCQVVRHPYQRGLLSIVRSLIHPGGGRCQHCSSIEGSWRRSGDLFPDLLQAADGNRLAGLLRALLDPKAYQVFVR